MIYWVTTANTIFILILIALFINYKNVQLNRFHPGYRRKKRAASPRYVRTSFTGSKKRKGRIPFLKYEKRFSNFVLGTLVFLVLVILAGYHLLRASQSTFWTTPIVIVSFLWMVFTLFSSFANKTYAGVPPLLHSTVVIPVYNEDPESFRKVLESLSAQTVKPNVVYVVEDGSAPKNVVKHIFDDWKAGNPDIVSHYHTFKTPAKGRRRRLRSKNTLAKPPFLLQ